MGTQTSKLENTSPDINIIRIMDIIASKYILTQNFQDLQKLENKKYCDEITILTSEIIQDKLNYREIVYLNQRVKHGIIIDEHKKENVAFLKDNDLFSLDTPSARKKKRMCIGISRFYVRVAQLFAAIVNVINPEYSYIDNNRVRKTIPFMKKMYIPRNMRNRVSVSKSGICSNRIKAIMISALKNTDTGPNQSFVNTRKNTKKYNIKNNVCSMNVNEKYIYGKKNETKRLIDEPGIPELIHLYKDVYNSNINKYDAMSEKSENEYKRHLAEFYTAFTGEKDMPENIKNFRDIELRSYHKYPSCKDNIIKNNYNNVEISDSLMTRYGNAMSIMIKNMNDRQNKLIEILDKVFVFIIDKSQNVKEITIHPELNNQRLEDIINLARKYIVDVIIGCEKDFINTLNIFEGIIEELIKNSIENKIQNLKEQELEIISNI